MPKSLSEQLAPRASERPTSRRDFLSGGGSAALALTLGGSGLAAHAASAQKPNIIFILADDLGYADLSCYGQREFRTPVLDRLAQDGVRLTQGYANSAICSPTRVAIATGCYQQRFKCGLDEPNGPFVPGNELPLGTPTIASVLREQGYRTSLIGKWHVSPVPEFSPLKYGYDHFFGFPGGATDYFTHKFNMLVSNPKEGLYDGDQLTQRNGYLTDVLADEAIKQIQSTRNKPLFMSLHFTAPHWPWEAPTTDPNYQKTQKSFLDLEGGSLEVYAAMVTALDAAIGKVLDAVSAAGQAEHTLVIFTSDNGGERFSDMWPLSGVKGELLEGGIRVPLIARWPARIPKGRVSEQVMTSMDFLPTFLAAAGGRPDQRFDGMNLVGPLTGASADILRTLYWRFRANEQAAVRSGDWKYLRLGGKEHLFNLKRDPRERVFLKDLHPDVFADLKAKHSAWNATVLPYLEHLRSEDVRKTYPDRY